MRKTRFRIDKRSVLWSVGMAAVTAGFLFLATGAQIERISDLKAQIADEREELTACQKSPQSIACLQGEVRGLTVATANFDEQIPKKPDVGTLLQKLAWFTQSRNLRPESIKPGEPAAFSEVTALPILMRVRGPFPAIFALVKDIEQMPRLTQVERFVVTKDENEEAAVSAELAFKVFFRAS